MKFLNKRARARKGCWKSNHRTCARHASINFRRTRTYSSFERLVFAALSRLARLPTCMLADEVCRECNETGRSTTLSRLRKYVAL